LNWLFLISAGVGVVNLLPIPVLDGGHIVFSIIEAIRRKPLNQKFLESTQVVFIALLLTFMIYVTFNDFGRMAKWGMFARSAKSTPASTNAPPVQSEPGK